MGIKIVKKMTMNKKSLQIIVAILSLNILFGVFSFAQDGRITITVKNEDGNPVPGATVIVGEGARAVSTNENGEFFIPPDSVVSILVD